MGTHASCDETVDKVAYISAFLGRYTVYDLNNLYLIPDDSVCDEGACVGKNIVALIGGDTVYGVNNLCFIIASGRGQVSSSEFRRVYHNCDRIS